MPSNFTFLAREFPVLYNIGTTAELCFHQNSVYHLAKLRSLGEKQPEIFFTEHETESPTDNSIDNQLKTVADENFCPLQLETYFS